VLEGKRGDHTFVTRSSDFAPNKSRHPVFTPEAKRTDRSFGANGTAGDLYKIGRTRSLGQKHWGVP
jgi:hypothetical protein